MSYEEKTSIFYACLFLEDAKTNYVYDPKYNLIYDSERTSIEDIENEVIKEYGNLLAKSKYNLLKGLKREIIDNNYTQVGKQRNLFKYRKCNKTDFLVDLIDEIFPNGYHLYSEDDYSVLRNEYINALGDDLEPPSMAAVRGVLSRDMFCQIGRGMYKIRRKCHEIPNELLNVIFDFINSRLPVVDYITIYTQFEDELKLLGIDNYHYMKGIIDHSLPDDLITQRNYITESSSRITAIEARLAFMKSFDLTFSMDDLKEKYPGIKPYVFAFQIYSEEKNGLIQIGNGKYIYFD